jgi:hypothetical protein
VLIEWSAIQREVWDRLHRQVLAKNSRPDTTVIIEDVFQIVLLIRLSHHHELVWALVILPSSAVLLFTPTGNHSNLKGLWLVRAWSLEATAVYSTGYGFNVAHNLAL